MPAINVDLRLVIVAVPTSSAVFLQHCAKINSEIKFHSVAK